MINEEQYKDLVIFYLKKDDKNEKECNELVKILDGSEVEFIKTSNFTKKTYQFYENVILYIDEKYYETLSHNICSNKYYNILNEYFRKAYRETEEYAYGSLEIKIKNTSIYNITQKNIGKFLKEKNYELKDSIGSGACGETRKIYDSILDLYFICKKFSPKIQNLKDKLFNRFIKEIKILMSLNHKNIVRIYDYYIYSKIQVGFIIMEYIEGNTIYDYIKNNPEKINLIFLQVIDAFVYLEENKVFHRDIKPDNILVDKNDNVKIIDFGFSEKKYNESDSMSATIQSDIKNWFCDKLPEELDVITNSDKNYNSQTDMYFIGCLFEKKLNDNFQYKNIIKKMKEYNVNNRYKNFKEIKNEIDSYLSNNIVMNNDFSPKEINIYNKFTNKVCSTIHSFHNNEILFEDNINDIISNLYSIYYNNQLNNNLSQKACSDIIACFVKSAYRYYTKIIFEIDILKNFLELLKKSNKEKQNIIIKNFQSKLSSIQIIQDDIPF